MVWYHTIYGDRFWITHFFSVLLAPTTTSTTITKPPWLYHPPTTLHTQLYKGYIDATKMEMSFFPHEAASIQEAEEQMLVALRLLDPCLAREHRLAMEHVPFLVQEESKLLDFLRTEGTESFSVVVVI
jgi:hypothetical protein